MVIKWTFEIDDDQTYSGSCLGCGALSRARQGVTRPDFAAGPFPEGATLPHFFPGHFLDTLSYLCPVHWHSHRGIYHSTIFWFILWTANCSLQTVNCKLYPGGAWELHWRELVLGGRAGGLCTINDTGMTCPASKNQIWKIQNLISPPFCIAHHINWSRQ